MTGLGRRLNCVLSAHFPEKRLFIQSGDVTRYLRLSPLSQFLSGSAGLFGVAWVAVATATVAIDLVSPNAGTAPAVVIQSAYQTRLEELATERDQRAAEARSAQE